jgi:hypothetical protein
MRHLRTIPSPFDEFGSVSNLDRPTFDDLAENSGAPVRAERFAEAGLRFLHLLAWTRLAENAHEGGAEPEKFAAGISERDSAHHDVRARFEGSTSTPVSAAASAHAASSMIVI